MKVLAFICSGLNSFSMSLTLKVLVSPLLFFQLISKVDFSFSAVFPIATVAIKTHAPIFFILLCYLFLFLIKIEKFCNLYLNLSSVLIITKNNFSFVVLRIIKIVFVHNYFIYFHKLLFCYYNSL